MIMEMNERGVPKCGPLNTVKIPFVSNILWVEGNMNFPQFLGNRLRISHVQAHFSSIICLFIRVTRTKPESCLDSSFTVSLNNRAS